MSIEVKHRRGTTAERMAITLAEAEIGFDTTTKELVVGDGQTPGGIPQAKKVHSHAPFVGATSGAPGQPGFVPAPAAGQQARVLRGDGAWVLNEPVIPDGSLSLAKLENIASATLLGRSATGAGPVSALPISDLRFDLALEPLVASYTGAQLAGQSSVTLDLPSGFSTFRLRAEGLSAASPATVTLRCGAAGGALDTGATDYSVTTYGREGDTVVGFSTRASGVGVTAFGVNGINLLEMLICDGSASGFWRVLGSTMAQIADGNIRSTEVAAFRVVSGARKRLSIISTVAFANSGSIKIYGVRP